MVYINIVHNFIVTPISNVNISLYEAINSHNIAAQNVPEFCHALLNKPSRE